MEEWVEAETHTTGIMIHLLANTNLRDEHPMMNEGELLSQLSMYLSLFIPK